MTTDPTPPTSREIAERINKTLIVRHNFQISGQVQQELTDIISTHVSALHKRIEALEKENSELKARQ